MKDIIEYFKELEYDTWARMLITIMFLVVTYMIVDFLYPRLEFIGFVVVVLCLILLYGIYSLIKN